MLPSGKREYIKMFLIEYVMAQGRAEPSVVYRSGISATLDAAEQVGQGTLDVVRRMFPTTPPNGFQIFDDNDEVVLRSWESIPLRLSAFGVTPCSIFREDLDAASPRGSVSSRARSAAARDGSRKSDTARRSGGASPVSLPNDLGNRHLPGLPTC